MNYAQNIYYTNEYRFKELGEIVDNKQSDLSGCAFGQAMKYSLCGLFFIVKTIN